MPPPGSVHTEDAAPLTPSGSAAAQQLSSLGAEDTALDSDLDDSPPPAGGDAPCEDIDLDDSPPPTGVDAPCEDIDLDSPTAAFESPVMRVPLPRAAANSATVANSAAAANSAANNAAAASSPAIAAALPPAAASADAAAQPQPGPADEASEFFYSVAGDAPPGPADGDSDLDEADGDSASLDLSLIHI